MIRAALICFALALASAPAQDTLTLKQTYPLNKRVVKKTTTKQVQSMTTPFSPEPIEQKTNQEQTVSVEVRPAANGNKVVTVEHLAVKMDMTAGPQSFSYDSTKDKEAAGHPLAVMGKLVGMKISLHLNAEGEVIKLEGVDEFMESVGAGNPMVAKMFNKDFFSKTMRSALTQAMPPEKKTLKLGDSFDVSTELELPMVGTMVNAASYTFEGFEQVDGYKCGKLAFTGKISTKEGDAPAQPGMKATIKDGTMKGTVFYDPKLGIDIKSSMTQSFDMNIATPQGVGMQTKITSTVENVLVKIEDL